MPKRPPAEMPKRPPRRSREAPESPAGERQRKKRASRKDPQGAPNKTSQKATRKDPQSASRSPKVPARKRTGGAKASAPPNKARALRRAAQPQERPKKAGPAPVAVQTRDLDARLAFFERARRYAPYLGVEVDGGRFVVSTADGGLSRGMFGKRGRPEFKALARAVTVIQILAGEDAVKDTLFVDVGANIGTTTVAAMLSHHFGAAVCVEPEAENYRLLRANLALNGLEDEVRCLRVAVSNRTGRSLLVVAEGGGSRHWIAEDLDMVRRAEEAQAALAAENPEHEVKEMVPIEVEVVTLDELADSGVIDKERVGMVWIDAESHEGHILQGGRGLLDNGPAVVFEFHPAGLQERGDLDQIYSIAEDVYTHFVDVRRQDAGRPRFELHAVGQLRAYADRMLATTGERFFTDLLLLRLDKTQTSKGSDLPRLVAERLASGSAHEDLSP